MVAPRGLAQAAPATTVRLLPDRSAPTRAGHAPATLLAALLRPPTAERPGPGRAASPRHRGATCQGPGPPPAPAGADAGSGRRTARADRGGARHRYPGDLLGSELYGGHLPGCLCGSRGADAARRDDRPPWPCPPIPVSGRGDGERRPEGRPAAGLALQVGRRHSHAEGVLTGSARDG